MITINGQKMARSLGNYITLDELYSGNHEMLEKAYSPMTIRFFVLQAHYRSTIDFSNEALQASEKGLERLMTAVGLLNNLPVSSESTVDILQLKEKSLAALNDDLNSPVAIAHLFDGVRIINSIKTGKEKISVEDLRKLKQFFHSMVFDILGLREETKSQLADNNILNGTINLLLNLRMDAKAGKDWKTADKIRNELNALGVEIKDTKEGFEWNLK
jgi:cysteinyl-tRNA synthetase